MADKRAFFKLDVGYYDNPKIVPLLDEDQPWAVHLHQASMAYSAQHLTDGVVRVKTMLRKIPATDSDVQALIAAGLWIDLGDGQVRVHDYLEHNRSAAEAKSATDKARRAAAARYVAAPGEPPEHAHDDASSTASSSASSTASGMPRERERKREKKELTSDADASDNPRFSEDVTRLSDLLAELVTANGHKGKVGHQWHQACDRLMRLDGYTPEQVEWIIRWATANEFWSANIRSMSTLREKFSTLKAQALAGRDAAKPAAPPALDDDQWRFR